MGSYPDRSRRRARAGRGRTARSTGPMGPPATIAVRRHTRGRVSWGLGSRYFRPGDANGPRGMVLPHREASLSDLPPVEMPRDADGPRLPPEDGSPPTLRPSSFTERYRGSTYGTPLPTPPPVNEPRGNRTLVIVGVGILVLAVAAGGALLFLGQRQPLPPPARTADVAALRGEQTMGLFRAWVADTAGVLFHENLDETVSAQAFGGLIKGDLD